MANQIPNREVVGYKGQASTDCCLKQPLLVEVASQRFSFQSSVLTSKREPAYYELDQIRYLFESGQVTLFTGNVEEVPRPTIPAIPSGIVVSMSGKFIAAIQKLWGTTEVSGFAHGKLIPVLGDEREFAFYLEQDAALDLTQRWAKRFEMAATAEMNRTGLYGIDHCEEAVEYVRMGRQCAVEEATRWDLLVMHGEILATTSRQDLAKLYEFIVRVEFPDIDRKKFFDAIEHNLAAATLVRQARAVRTPASETAFRIAADMGNVIPDIATLHRGQPEEVKRISDETSRQMREFVERNAE